MNAIQQLCWQTATSATPTIAFPAFNMVSGRGTSRRIMDAANERNKWIRLLAYLTGLIRHELLP
jgi:hypothetical protein